MEDIVNSNLLHMVCMLLCVAVVACVFIRYYSKGKDIECNENRIQKLHTFYIVGILAFIIIELITGIGMKQDNRADILSYVSFAATLSSLIMSVVAIIFTIVFSSRGDEQYKKIDNASEKVNQSLATFSDRTNDLDQSIELFKNTSDSLTIKLDAILNGLKEVKGATDEIKDNLSNQKQVISSVSEASLNNVESEKLIEHFILSGSFNGNCALYACVLSKDNNKKFSLSKISIGTPSAISYMYGYIVAASSLGIIDGDLDRDECSINNYLPTIKPLLETAIQDYINKSKDSKQKRKAKFDKIKSLFEE